MQNLVRQEVIQTARTVIVKVGTNVLSRDDDTLDIDRIEQLVEQLHKIRSSGRKVVLISSGAIGAGMGLLSLKKRPEDLPHLQAAAATGQAHLIHVYDGCFRKYGYHAAQLLLTINDFKSRKRYLNVQNTLSTLFEYGVIPIVNENDTVSIEEIKFGDNDQLASMIATLVPRPLMVILSSIDGLFDGSPDSPDSRLISTVEQPGESLLQHVTGTTSSRGRGGMATKLKAILNAVSTGESVILANGRAPGILDKIAAGEDVGTVFVARGESIPAWKRWIALAAQPAGRITVDDGAVRALTTQGRSLLAVGIRSVNHTFAQGASVDIADEQGTVIARGLVNYSSDEIQSIAGRKSAELPAILGHVPYGEVVHRDNMMLVDPLASDAG